MKKVTGAQMLEFDEQAQQTIKSLAQREGVIAVVLFVNMQLDSSQLGTASVLAVGPGCTYKTVEELEGRHLNDLPSQRQYAVAWAPAEEIR